ncbi:RNase H domain-containing protein [Trichonephila clavipes]|nr:RNase H domain-containing protein [Trichonephila clavipes]
MYRTEARNHLGGRLTKPHACWFTEGIFSLLPPIGKPIEAFRDPLPGDSPCRGYRLPLGKNDVKITIRNPDHCSVFRLELIVISGALNSYKDSIWILKDSRSSIQYLKNWPKIMDGTGLDILSKLIRLGHRKQVCLQWIPSHVGVPGNEAADELAGRGCDLLNP